MWLRTSWAAAEEELLYMFLQGSKLHERLMDRYDRMLHDGMGDEGHESERALTARRRWMSVVEARLRAIFPSAREVYVFRRYGQPISDNGELYFAVLAEIKRLDLLVYGLDQIRLVEMKRYAGAPPPVRRLFVEDIDSFVRVRSVNPQMVANVLRNGRVELLEDVVQRAFEKILDVSFRRVDFGGEINDLYTSNLLVNGQRTPTAFMLKGRGCTSRELRIADCGKNGDQLVRLFESPADLFIVQYVGAVSDAVIRDLEGKIAERRAAKKPAWFCVIDGQDTARLLTAYGIDIPGTTASSESLPGKALKPASKPRSRRKARG